MTSILTFPSDDLWRDKSYRRLWLSVLISSFGGQIASIALSLTSAMLLQATPTQMGILGEIGVAPVILFSLPSGVWLDRVRKLPIYIAGEIIMAATLATVTLALSLGQLNMAFLYGMAFISSCVSVISGTAAQIVLTQIVSREQLVEAHAKKGLATSFAEIAGPGVAGVLIRLIGTPLALLTNCAFLMASVLLLRGVHVTEAPLTRQAAHFWQNLKEGILFVAHNRLLRSLAFVVGLWQVCQTTAMVVQVLFAIRTLGLNEYQYGLCFSVAGIGTIVASAIGHRISHCIGPGPCFIAGIAISGIGWLQLACVPAGIWGVVSFEAMLLSFSAGAVLIFSNMLALRQSITPAPLLARMTSTMRFITLLPAGPGALLGGIIGDNFGLRAAIGMGGLGAIALAIFVWRFSFIRHVIEIPKSGSEVPL